MPKKGKFIENSLSLFRLSETYVRMGICNSQEALTGKHIDGSSMSINPRGLESWQWRKEKNNKRESLNSHQYLARPINRKPHRKINAHEGKRQGRIPHQ